MDPLSVTANILAVLGAARAVVSALESLIALKNAPAEFVKLSNEIADLRAVLTLFNDTFQTTDVAISASQSQCLKQLLQRAESVLNTIAGITATVLNLELTESNLVGDQYPNLTNLHQKPNWKRRTLWVFRRGKIESHLIEFREVRQNLIAAMTNCNLTQTPRLYLTINDILQCSKSIERGIYNLEKITDEKFSNHHLVQREVPRPRKSSFLGNTDDKASSNKFLALPVTVHRPRSCSLTCSCRCHGGSTFKLPHYISILAGDLTITTSGMPLFNRAWRFCNEDLCLSRGRGLLRLTYFFPSWLLERMISCRDSWSKITGHSMIIRSARIVSPTAEIFSFAQQGYIDGLKALFSDGLASPFDVCAGSGRSALNFAVTAKQPDTCLFLLTQCADAHLEDNNRLSALDCAWDWYFWGKIDEESPLLGVFGQNLKDPDNHRHRGFSVLHQIVLDIIEIDINAQLSISSSSDKNRQDTAGRTPLHWAAARGDFQAVKSLLQAGASTNILDARNQRPIQHCAMHGTSDCLGLLLESEVKEQASSSLGEIGSLPTSLTDNSDYQGRSLLHLACRSTDPSGAKVLLSYGADLEAKDHQGRTPLFLAIYWNRHDTISYLLQAGAWTGTRNIEGQTILHWAARLADTRTLKILVMAGISSIDIEHRDSKGQTARQLFNERPDVSEDTDENLRRREYDAQLFEELLSMGSQTRITNLCDQLAPEQTGISKRASSRYCDRNLIALFAITLFLLLVWHGHHWALG